MHAELLIDGFFVGGPCDQSTGKTVIRAPFGGAIVGTAAEGGLSELRACVDAAHEAFQTWRHSQVSTRQALLRNVAKLVRERAGELTDLLTLEVGKPVVWSRGEVDRLARTFDFAADMLSDFGVESVPLDKDPRGEGTTCEYERFPIGVVFAIVPYNWPYNLSAHKIAPALATGNTVVVKPSPLAPLSTLELVRLIHDAGCPPGVINAWTGEPKWAQKVLVEDRRIRMLSFTGSAAVGWKLKELLPDRKVLLELGGDASVIVAEDADLDWAVKRIVPAAFGYAGQICISVQHVLAHSSVYDELRERLVEATKACVTGDPAREETVCGPMIDEDAAVRLNTWIDEATAAGAKVLAGGERDGNMMSPTLIECVPLETKLGCEEAFGPVLTLSAFDDLDQAIARVNASKYGLQAAVFSASPEVADRCYRGLEVGGVVVNDAPTLRFDNMPYGGVKQSGFGREGVRFAAMEMTEPRVRLTVRIPPGSA